MFAAMTFLLCRKTVGIHPARYGVGMGVKLNLSMVS